MSAAKRTPKQEAIRLISEVDLLLSMVNSQMADARTDTERTKHLEQIDLLLDERINIMKTRDKA